MSSFPSRLPALVASAILMICAVAGPVRAQDASPSHLAAARDLLIMTGSLTSVDSVLPQFGESIMRRQVTRPELSKDLKEVIDGLKPEMELQRQLLMNEATKIYTRLMTEAELKETIAFFKTASGQKYLSIQPKLTDDVVNAVEVWTQQVSEYTMVRVRAEMSKRGFQLQ